MWRPFLSGPLLAVGSISRESLAFETLHSGRLLRRWTSNVKMTKELKRMFDRRAGSKKKKIFPGPVNLGINSSEDADFKPQRKPVYTEGQKRRAQQVGKVLYDNIVHLINSGEMSEQLASLSVEIVRVKVVPDFSAVNVYWLSSGTKEDDTVQTLLNKNAGHLRHLLTSLHLLGSIPRICFVRDDSQARYLEVEALLCTADFGPDFIPTRLDSAIRSMAQLPREDASSPEEDLQAQFNALNIKAAVGEEMGHTSEPLPAQERDFHSRELEEGTGTQDLDDSEKSKAAEKSNVSDPLCVTSEDSKSLGHQQHSLSQPPSFQPSSLDVQQLTRQYLSSLQESDDKAQNPDRAALSDYTAVTLSKVFRDDMYKVPHSELLNKVLMKKQRAGLRPDRMVSESETVVPKVSSTSFKSLLQKKAKSKGRVKPQWDHYGTDFTEMNREDAYTDDLEDYSDEEMEEDFFPTNDPPSRK